MKESFLNKYISMILLIITLFNFVQLPINVAYGAISYSGQTGVGNYTISTTEQLNLLAEKVNSGTSYVGSTFTMTNNITYDSSIENNYIPIGKSEVPFKGKFDGNGFSISGININQFSSSYIGIFGYIDNATIINLTLNNSTIKALNYAGGVVGYAQNSILENCNNNSSINSSLDYHETTGIIGGVVGYGYKITVKNSSNNGEIFGLNIGGIVGELKGTDINHGIFNSINNGEYESSGNQTTRSSGGIVGRAENIEIRNCVNTANSLSAWCVNNSGGIAGIIDNVKIYYSSNKAQRTYTGGIVGTMRESLVYGCINMATVVSYATSIYDQYNGGIASMSENSEIIYSTNRGGVYCTIEVGRDHADKIYNGGLVGYANNTNISYSYNLGFVYSYINKDKGHTVGAEYLGGIIGYSDINCTIKHSFNTGYVGYYKKTNFSPFTDAAPITIGSTSNINVTSSYYIDKDIEYLNYKNIGQSQTEAYMKSQEFVNLLNTGTSGSSEKNIKDPFLKATQNGGYPIFWYEQKVESLMIEGSSSIIKGDAIVLTVKTLPERAGYRNISWSDSGNMIIDLTTVGDGKSLIVQGIRKGETTIQVTVTNNDGSIKTTSKEITVVSNFIPSEANYILVNEEIEYKKAWEDTENDPLFKEEYRFIHTPTSFKDNIKVDNNMGYVSYNNKWQDVFYTSFSKVGTYKILYSVQDNPPTASKANFENYRYYSDVAESTIYVHRKPIASYNINITSMTDYSFDLDHSISDINKGIVEWKWTCVNSDGGNTISYTKTNKSTGQAQVNSWINDNKNKEFKLILKVKDLEGAWSEPCIKSMGEVSKPIADFSIEKNPLIYPENQVITDMSYDTNIPVLPLSYQWTINKDGINVLNSNNRDISNSLNQKIKDLFPNITGTYDINLKVINGAGVESDMVTKSFYVTVYNYTPDIDFNLISNESPVWTFPKNIGLYTLKYRPSDTLFFEEKAKFDVNVTDANTDNTGYVYDWKLERFAVKNIDDISGATAKNIYNYNGDGTIVQPPLITNSFKGQGLPWGAYRITLNVTDKPPIPPYESAKSAELIKYYYIVPEISLTGDFESTKPEILVGDTITLKATTSNLVDSVHCTLEGNTYNMIKKSEVGSNIYWEKDIVVPDDITESEAYNLQFVGKTTYGGNGNVTREVKDTVPIDIIALKLINFRIEGIVNHPYITFPYTKDMLELNLIPYKTGYKVTFQIDSKGKPENVYGRIDVGDNGSIDKVISMEKISTGTTETWLGTFYTSTRLSNNTIISIELGCNKGSTVYNYNNKESWDGRSLIVNGSALQDGRVNLTR